MGSQPKPQAPAKPSPPIQMTAADQAQAALEQQRQEKKRADYGKTVGTHPMFLGTLMDPARRNAMPPGLKSTLG